MSDNKKHGIAIVGLGGCFPGADNVETFWKNICAGHVAIREVPKDRWDPELYFSIDHAAPEKTYSKIGGFIERVRFDSKRFRIPPKTLGAIDDVQKMALTAVADALQDAGLETLPGSNDGKIFDRNRVAVILGNSMGGEAEDLTSLRIWFAQVKASLEQTAVFNGLDRGKKEELLKEIEQRFKGRLPEVTEDSMPGELANCIAGRIANVFDLRGPNFTTDAACAASMASLRSACQSLEVGDVDLAITGGADRSMDPPTFVKFSKIGALSAEISAPFDARANGFVMGEGVGILVLKRLADAERDGDRIYAVVRGVGAASDGKGKGITAPNPRGQKLAIERAYADANVPLQTVGLFEAHGTSTTVGDATEAQVLSEMLQNAGAPKRGVPIGSVKSMIGHLKSAAGAASVIKSALALHHKTLPPSANFREAAADSPLRQGWLAVNTQARPWVADQAPRRAGVSAFGFGGTNFHIVLEEYAAGQSPSVTIPTSTEKNQQTNVVARAVAAPASAAGGTMASRDQLVSSITQIFAEKTGYAASDLDPHFHLEADLGIDTVKQAEIFSMLRERYGLERDENFRLADVPTLAKVVDYVATRMGQGAANTAPAKPLPSIEAGAPPAVVSPEVVVLGGSDAKTLLANVQEQLNKTSTLDEVLTDRHAALRAPARLAFVAEDLEQVKTKVAEAGKRKAKILAAQGIYLNDGVGTGAGKMAFLFPGQGSQYLGMFEDLSQKFPVVRATFEEADAILQPLIGKKLTDLMWRKTANEQETTQAELTLRSTENCQPAMLAADVAMLRLLAQYGVNPDMVAGHSLGEYAASVAAGVLSFADALYAVSARGREMAGVRVDDNGKMATVAGPADKVEAVLKTIDGYVIAANKNCHAQTVIAGATKAVEQAVARFAELGLEAREIPVSHAFHCKIVAPASVPLSKVLTNLQIQSPKIPILSNVNAKPYPSDKPQIVEMMTRQLESPVEFIATLERMYEEGVRTFVEVGPRRAITGFVRNVIGDRPHVAIATNHPKKPGLEGFLEALAALASEGVQIDFKGRSETVTRPSPVEVKPELHVAMGSITRTPSAENGVSREAIVVTGVSVALPSTKPTGDLSDDLIGDLLGGKNFIGTLSEEIQQQILRKKVVRLDKSRGQFTPLVDYSEVLQLAARVGRVNLVQDYGIDENFDDALDEASRLAIAVAIDALRDAGLPMVRHYRTTSTGKKLADRWGLPHKVGQRTGVILASCFSGIERAVDEASRQVAAQCAGDEARRLKDWLGVWTAQLTNKNDAEKLRQLGEAELQKLQGVADAYTFSRKYIMRILTMGHAQVAQTIFAQGPNVAINVACASGPVAIGIACDWLNLGRCDRVLVVTSDNITSDTCMPWFGAGFVAAGAATIEKDLAKAAVPFGANRNGMIIGSGGAAFVLERESDAAERGIEPIAEILDVHYQNSAFHGTRLDVGHVAENFDQVVAKTAATLGVQRDELARRSLFMSHETYTPARGGSAQAEVNAVRRAFGSDAKNILIANTKGYTGHAMAAAIEDVVALKGMQRGRMPAVANLQEVDPEFKDLCLSNGSSIDRDIAFHFAAGFGSQLAVTVYKRRARSEARLVSTEKYSTWLRRVAEQDNQGMEIHQRALRVAEQGGVALPQLNIASMQTSQVVVSGAAVSDTKTQTRGVAPVATADRATLLVELTKVFAERTGYDVSDLDPAHQLEADLGIDTVKQAEIFSSIRERYGLGKDESFRLSDVPTLNAVVDYVAQRMTSVDRHAPAVPQEVVMPEVKAPATVVTSPMVSSNREQLLREIAQLFAERTGYELTDLDPAHQLEADLGIDTVKQAEIFSVLRERYGLAKDETFRLSDVPTLNAVVEYVAGKMPSFVAAQTSPSQSASDVVTPSVSPSASEQTAPAGDLLKEITAIFAERTGYDVADLDSTHQLEADLGIDTVKQAEIFSQLRERYGFAKDPDFKLSDVQTLEAVAHYVKTRLNQGVSSASDTKMVSHGAAPAQSVVATNNGVDARFKMWNVQAVPMPLSGQKINLDKRHVLLTGGDSATRAVIARALVQEGARVHTLEHTAGSDAALENEMKEKVAARLDDLVVLCSAPDVLDGRIMEAQLQDVFALCRAFGRAKQNDSRGLKGARILLLSSAGQVFGARGSDAGAALLGGLAGVAKSLAKEWSGARCVAVDMQKLNTEADAKKALEPWFAEGAQELAWYDEKWWTLRRTSTIEARAENLRPHGVVVATGGARGVTYAILSELARRMPLKIVILARTKALRAEDSPLAGLSESACRDAAKAALTLSGERATPLAIKNWVDRHLAQIEVAANLETLRKLGSEVELVAADISNDAALADVLAKIKSSYTDIDLVLHGAGSEESRLLVDKDVHAFSRMFRPKARAGLRILQQLKPKRFISMGSVAGRFGNAGQADYSAANEVLAALARGSTNILNISWTAWDDVGMAVRGSTKQILTSAGVDMLPVAVGARLGADLCASNIVGEVVVAGALGAFASAEPSVSSEQLPIALFDVVQSQGPKQVYTRTIVPQRDPGLDHHRIDGVAVLPGVLGVELMTQAAQHACRRTATALKNVRFHAPVKFHRDDAMDIHVEVDLQTSPTAVKLFTLFAGPGGKVVRREHFSTEVLFGTAEDLSAPAPWNLDLAHDPKVTRRDVYRRYFHGPVFQVLQSIMNVGENGASARVIDTRPVWLQNVGHTQFVTSPLMREAGFQIAGLWEMMEVGRMALPAGIHYLKLSQPTHETALFVEARQRSSSAAGGVFDVWVRDEAGRIYDVMLGYQTVTLRALEESERFEPAPAKLEVPDNMVLQQAEVTQMLKGDVQALTQHYLSPTEQKVFSELKTPKRQQDWLAGRIVAKRLLRERRFATEDAVIPYGAISILADPMGAPEIAIVGESLPGPRMSIAHGGGLAVAMIATQANERPGIDVEVVEKREEGFAADYFTEGEVTVARMSPDFDRTLTVMWALKEAVLKALGIGARVDMREVVTQLRNGRWSVRLMGEAHKRAETLGAQNIDANLEEMGKMVVARVRLFVANDTEHSKVHTTEVVL